MSNEDLLAELVAESVAEETPAHPVDALEHAQRLAAEVNTLTARIEKGRAFLAELEGRKNTILSKELVELMDEKKIGKLEVDGQEFKASPYYKASIPEEHRDVAHDWLEEHDAGDLINNTIIVELPKDSEDMAKEIEDYIRKRYQEASVERKRMVPWARLTSWLKELAESDDIAKILPPLDIMGATIGRIVKIKPLKKK